MDIRRTWYLSREKGFTRCTCSFSFPIKLWPCVLACVTVSVTGQSFASSGRMPVPCDFAELCFVLVIAAVTWASPKANPLSPLLTPSPLSSCV